MKHIFSWLHEPETQKLLAAFPIGGLYFVGGCVRNSLIGQKVDDIDCATPLPPEHVIACLNENHIPYKPVGIEHGTILAIIDRKPFEITTFRKDVETNGRHAIVSFTNNMQEDAARRDFTVNALYMDSEGTLFDFFGGLEDLHQKKIRFIGNADARIIEDYLRILRFFRFHVFYGEGKPDADSLSACLRHKKFLVKLSKERVNKEFLKILQATNTQKVSEIISLFETEHILPLLSEELAYSSKIATDFPADFRLLLRLCVLTQGKNLRIFQNDLRVSNDLIRQIEHVFKALQTLEEDLACPFYRLKSRFPEHTALPAYWYFCVTREKQIDSQVVDFLKSPRPFFPITGKDITDLGLSGKDVGDVLEKIRCLWEESEFALTREEMLTKITHL